MYAAVTLLPAVGIALGYIAASIFRTSYTIRRTVAIECGIQNVGTALAIVSLSYPYHVSIYLCLCDKATHLRAVARTQVKSVSRK